VGAWAWALAVQAGTIHAAPLPPRPLAAQEQQGLEGEQRQVQLQSLAAVRADPEAWIVRYLERITTVRAASGAVVIDDLPVLRLAADAFQIKRACGASWHR
jgi:hypothetical protein